MTDFERLMRVLEVPYPQWERLFKEFSSGESQLVIEIHQDGSISWGTM